MSVGVCGCVCVFVWVRGVHGGMSMDVCNMCVHVYVCAHVCVHGEDVDVGGYLLYTHVHVYT